MKNLIFFNYLKMIKYHSHKYITICIICLKICDSKFLKF